MPDAGEKSKTLKLKKREYKGLDFAMGAGLGIVFFLLVYGASTLNVTYDAWIYEGYMEVDIMQRYAGWLYYRAAPWSWPLTLASNISVPYGVNIVFTDSIPLVAILCKVLSPWLPSTFQYFGWYNLVSCALQGGFAVLLLRRFQLSRLVAGVGSVLFISMPVFVERLFRHDALGSHWLILAAMLLYFKARQEKAFPLAGFAVLCAMAPGTTMYFVPMVYVFLAAALLERLRGVKAIWYCGWRALVCGACTLGMCWFLGMFSQGGGGAAEGFGLFSLNLNAPLNPVSINKYAPDGTLHWSRLLPVLPQQTYQYDGFNYLGAGILLGCAAMLGYGLVQACRWLVKGEKQRFGRVWRFVKSHLWLLLGCAALTMVAISNVVTWGGQTLFSYPLPDLALYLLSIFRASGRMFWPCAYLLALAVVVFCARVLRGRWRVVAVCALVVIQLWDISPTLQYYHGHFAQMPSRASAGYESESWRFMAENYDTVYCLGEMFDPVLAINLIRYNPEVQTNTLLANRGDFAQIRDTYMPMQEYLRSGQPLPDGVMYLCSDMDTFAYLLAGLHPEARGYRVGETYAFANPLPGCPVEGYPGGTVLV